MKRILGTVVAIAGVLAFSSSALAALVVFDVSGDVGYWSRSTDANASIPGSPENGGPCPTGMSTPVAGGCFRYSFQPGSSLTVDITGSAVTLMGGTLVMDTATPLVFGTILLTSHSVTNLFGGATGTLVGDDILWSTAASWNQDPYPTSWINCTGPNCSLISHPGFPIPIQPYLSAITNSTLASQLELGVWRLNGAHTDIAASSVAVASWSNVVEDPNRRQSGWTFGSSVIVPEPGSAALVLLGLGALALRSRKA